MSNNEKNTIFIISLLWLISQNVASIGHQFNCLFEFIEGKKQKLQDVYGCWFDKKYDVSNYVYCRQWMDNTVMSSLRNKCTFDMICRCLIIFSQFF